MKRTGGFRWVSVVAMIALVGTAACSGGPLPTAGGTASPGATVADLPSSGASSSPEVDAKTGKTKKGPKKGSPAGTSQEHTTGTTVSASGETVSNEEQAERSRKLAKGLPPVNLWPEATAQMGFTDDKIVFCSHAALTFAQVFDTRIEDLNIYWEMVNASGGIYGRRVEMTYEDDAYRPDQAVTAAEACKAKNPFILFGGIGFDQIPAVRAWNEQSQNRLLYIHHMARQDLEKQYSFSFFPSVEQAGTFAARWLMSAHSGDVIGAVWRQSEAWEPGHTTFKSTLESAGLELAADLPVQKDQAVYTQQIAELQSQNVETVFLWENALGATEFIAQAKRQDYHPTYVVFPFQLETDTLQEDSLDPPMEGVAFWPPYAPGVRGGPYAPYTDEIIKFEAAINEYATADEGNDILFMTWLAYKQMHQLLLDCGPDCDRNRLVALMISGRHKAVSPNCPFDFTANGHVAGLTGNIFKAIDVDGYGAAWAPFKTCVRI
ncbi:MAG TPA: ABC transporter substrate-binding protein [Actinomycetota bacterium]|nr:ABC transporter substrate-binding protein [Actinomycetota bacterium]